MRELEQHAFQTECRYIMLITDSDRQAAQRFYGALGYESSDYMAFKKKLHGQPE